LSFILFTPVFGQIENKSLSNSMIESDVYVISSSGGDCNKIGKWDYSKNTCTLNQDFDGFLDITGSNIMLDGNGFTISTKFNPEVLKENGDPRNGIIVAQADNIEIKNIVVKGFPEPGIRGQHPRIEIDSVGIGTKFENLTIKNSTLLNHNFGIYSEKECLIENNFILNNSVGIGSSKCKIIGNTISENEHGFLVRGSSNNKIENNYFSKNNVAVRIGLNDKIFNSTFIENWRPIVSESRGQENDNIKNNNFIQNTQYYVNGKENYYDFLSSDNEKCATSSNYCESISIIETGFQVRDPKPWKIKDGWKFKINVPETIDVITKNPDEVIEYSVSASGPEGNMDVNCTPSSGSLFPIGDNKVTCSLSNGFVSSFTVKILEQKIIEQKQFEENVESGSIPILKLSSLGLGIFAIILIFKMRKRKNELIQNAANSKSYDYHQYSSYENKSDDTFQQKFKDDASSNHSESFKAKTYDPTNLSKDEAFEILEVNENSAPEEIKNSRNRLINQWHPDKHKTPLYRDIAEKNSKLIISAYELLSKMGYLD
jgi:parallel beta-helix repeat protein